MGRLSSRRQSVGFEQGRRSVACWGSQMLSQEPLMKLRQKYDRSCPPPVYSVSCPPSKRQPENAARSAASDSASLCQLILG